MAGDATGRVLRGEAHAGCGGAHGWRRNGVVGEVGYGEFKRRGGAQGRKRLLHIVTTCVTTRCSRGAGGARGGVHAGCGGARGLRRDGVVREM